MSKYIMLQAPVERPGENNQILILDPTTYAGKHRIEKFYNSGWQKVGEIESEKTADFLTAGLGYNAREKLKEVCVQFGEIEKLAAQYASDALNPL